MKKMDYHLKQFFGSFSIRKKLRIAFFLSAILTLTIGGIYGIYFASRTLKANYLDEFAREVKDRGQELESTIMHAEGDLRFLTRLPTLKNYVRRMVPYGKPENAGVRGPVLEAFSNFAKFRSGIYQIRFIDSEGWERLRVDTKRGEVKITTLKHLQNKGERYYFQRAMKLPENQIYISSLDLNEEFGNVEVPHQLVVRFATPYFDESKQKRGVVVVNLYAMDLLASLRRLERRPGIKTFFVNADGTIISEEEPTTASEELTTLPFMPVQKLKNFVSRHQLSSQKAGSFESRDHFMVFVPVVYQKDQEELWWIGLQYPKKIILKPLGEFVITLLLMGFAMILILFFLGGLAARQLTTPLLAIHRETEKIGEGHFDVHLDVDTRDEIEELAHAINVMAGKVQELVEKEKGWNLRLQEEVLSAELKLTEVMKQAHQMEKMASLGELSAGIAHEIGNPLAAIKTVIQAMDENLSLENKKIYFERILSEIDRLSHFLKTFQTFVTPTTEAFVPCDLNVIVKNVMILVGKEAAKQGVKICEKLSPIPMIRGSAGGLQQILLNFLINALHAMPHGGDLILQTGRSSSGPSQILLSVTDNGIGISEDNLKRIFDPFFTTRTDGSGLGLAIAHKIAKEHGAKIHVKSQVGRGSTFIIRFSMMQDEE